MVARLYTYALRTTTQRWPLRKGLILQWNDGWGEISPLPGFSSETFEEAREEILRLLPDLPNARPKHPSVSFGIASASLPFSLAPLRHPLCLLNSPRSGFSTLKLKLGHLPIDEAIAHVKKHLGSYRLRLDCNRSWNLDEALYFARHFSPGDFDYLEEPVRTFAELVRFSELTQLPIAVDESLRTFPCLSIPTIKAAVVKPTVIGSLPSLPPHVPIVLSSAYESSLGLLQIARLALPSSLPLGLATYRAFLDDLLIPPLKAEDGFLIWLPTGAFPIDLSKLCLIATAS